MAGCTPVFLYEFLACFVGSGFWQGVVDADTVMETRASSKGCR